MPGFISNCACRGMNPKAVPVHNQRVRYDLVSDLMQERNVLRVICAPDGYGKSVLALQYAEIVFSFSDVYWISCKSPCFIRDLDAGKLASQIIQDAGGANLVVFDDLPNLDSHRTEMFSRTVDELLEYDCETLVTARPLNVEFIKLQKDCVIVDSKDMLLSDKELEKYPTLFKCEKISDRTADIFSRIPILAWGGKDALFKLIKSIATPEMTNAMLFIIFCIYILKAGSLNVIKPLVRKSDFALIESICQDYLHLGIDIQANSFCVPDVMVENLLIAFQEPMDSFIEEYGSKNSFGKKLAKLAIKNNDDPRAFEIIRNICTKRVRAAWLSRHSVQSITKLALSEAYLIHNDLRLSQKRGDTILRLFQAWRLVILSEDKNATRLAYEILENKKADNKLGVLAASIFVICGNPSEKFRAQKIIAYLQDELAQQETLQKEEEIDSQKYMVEQLNYGLYADIFSEITERIESSKDVFDWWNQYVDNSQVTTNSQEPNAQSKVLSDESVVAAALIMRFLEEIDLIYVQQESMRNFIYKVSAHLRKIQTSGSKITFFEYYIINRYKECMSIFNSVIDSPVLMVGNQIEKQIAFLKDRLISEKQKFLKVKNGIHYYGANQFNLEDYGNVLSRKMQIDPAAKQSSASKKATKELESKTFSQAVPVVKIEVFGGLKVYMDNYEIDPRFLTRQKVKVLLTMLICESGREINKNVVASTLWSDCTQETARKNINSAWSELRNILKLPDRSCPYLIRHQESYRLNMNLIESDVQNLEKICTRLTMGKIEAEEWSTIIESNLEIFRGELLPSESNNEYILRKRAEYKQKIVDAVVSAAERLIMAGQLQQALWFAHLAINCDSGREDAYAVLMRVQYATGKRTPALETYFACKRYLDKEMGMTPSRALTKLYDEILKDEVNEL